MEISLGEIVYLACVPFGMGIVVVPSCPLGFGISRVVSSCASRNITNPEATRIYARWAEWKQRQQKLTEQSRCFIECSEYFIQFRIMEYLLQYDMHYERNAMPYYLKPLQHNVQDRSRSHKQKLSARKLPLVFLHISRGSLMRLITCVQ